MNLSKFIKFLKKKKSIIAAIILLILIEGLLLIELPKLSITGTNRITTINEIETKQKTEKTIFDFSQNYKNQLIKTILPNFNKTNLKFTIEEAIKIREEILNITEKKEGQPHNQPLLLAQDIKKGEKLICGELAYLYGATLDALGFQVRQAITTRSLFDRFDNHSFIEIWDDQKKKWILSDPTFNISLKYKNKYLSAAETYNLIHQGKQHQILLENSSKSKYQYNLKKYYISYFSLFDNVLYIKEKRANKNPLGLTPIRYFQSKYQYTLLQSSQFKNQSNEIILQNAIVLLTIVIIPIALTILAIFLLFSFLSKRQIIKLSPPTTS